MKNVNYIINLDQASDDAFRVMSDRINLADGKSRSVGTLTRTFTYPDDPFYGELSITRSMMTQMVKNFDDNVYGQKIYINQAHCDSHGAAGEIVRVFMEKNKLKAEIEWTGFGIDLIQNKGFRYFSAEFVEDYKDPETEKRYGATLLGAALTIRPRVKHLDPIRPEELELSETDEEKHCLILPNVKRMLSEEITKMWEKLRKQLEEKLKKLKHLSEAQVKKILSDFDEKVAKMTEESQAQQLADGYESVATQLSEMIDSGQAKPDAPINLSVNLDEGKTLTEEDITAAVQKKLDEQAAAKKTLTETLEGNVKKFTDALEANESFKALSEDQKKVLSEAKDLITAEMSEDQVNKLAENQLRLAENLSVQTQLAAKGFQGAQGRVQITSDESNTIKGLQETIDKRLGYVEMSDAERYSANGGQLPEKNKKFVEKVLAEFDAERAHVLHEEAKHLAGGVGSISDTAVPVIVERTVIREALYNLTMLNFVDIGTYPFGNTADIPYSYRDSAAAGKGDTRTYEGQPINRAGVIQTTEEARPIPQKIAFKVSDEMRYLTSASVLNWEVVAENTRNAVRVIGEDTEQVGMNEILHSTLEFGGVAVSGEDLEPQADDTNNVFLLANFPVVRPRKVYDLKGNQVGSTVNAITVTYNSVVREEYDGTGTQAAGIYYVLDYDLGEIYLVNETGVIQTPANGTAYTINYTRATNVYAFDTDLPANTKVKEHWDDFLYRYGLRKALIKSQRFYRADLGIMSDTFKTSIERAETFSANFSRPGTDLNADGDLGRIKGIPNFSTTAPGLHIGDRYSIIGERNTTRFRMMKAWQMGQLENCRDSNGKMTGEKEAYGDQFIVVHTPTQLKAASTAIMQYSASARVARVNP